MVSFFQLTGHEGAFKRGFRDETILKKSQGNEEQCLRCLMEDNNLRRFVPRFYRRVHLEQDGITYLEMDDLLYRFNFDELSIMDIKMGCRTYQESELRMALEETKLRPDMYNKMIEIDPNEPTREEKAVGAITKTRYMIWRETLSSTENLAFRIEAMRLKDGTVDKNFKRTKSIDQVVDVLRRFIGYSNTLIIQSYLKKLEELREALNQSEFFQCHELIGCSLLLFHDYEKAEVWLIDFGKTQILPDSVRVTHLKKWELGNREDGFLLGINNLIEIFKSMLHY